MSRPPASRITPDEIKSFRDDGIVCLRQRFRVEQIEMLRRQAERSLSRPSGLHAELAAERGEAGRFFHDTFVWRHNEECKSFLSQSGAARLARDLMGSSKINLLFDQWLIKEPGTITQTPWHNDQPYWPIKGFDVCTLWIALDEVTATTGAVEYVKGSHHWNRRYKPASFSGSNQYEEDLEKTPDIDAMRDALDIVHFEMAPGDCTIHHGLLVHGSPGNQSTELRRRAYVVRWTGDDVVFDPRPGIQEMPTLPDIPIGGPIDSDLWPVML